MSNPANIQLEYLRTQAVWYLTRWLGIFYKWGGDDPSGWDCNGLIHEVLQAVGLEPHGFDCTAHELYLRHKDKKEDKPFPGRLIFWFKSGKAIHVEMCFDEYLAVGASGGGSKTNTREDAIKYNAFVKMRPWNYRGESYKIIDPFKEPVDWPISE